MNSDYLIVSKKILPDYYEKVLEARRLLDSGAAEDVSSAVRQAGISRSTYYKYKDAIYTPESADTGRKAVISMLLSHQIGVLSNVLNRLSALGVNVLADHLPKHAHSRHGQRGNDAGYRPAERQPGKRHCSAGRDARGRKRHAGFH